MFDLSSIDTVVATVPAIPGCCCRRRRSSCRRWRSPLRWAACRRRTWERKEMNNQWKWRISISATDRLYREIAFTGAAETIAMKRRYQNLEGLSGNYEFLGSISLTSQPASHSDPCIDIVPLPCSRRAGEWGGGGRGEDPSETWGTILIEWTIEQFRNQWR